MAHAANEFRIPHMRWPDDGGRLLLVEKETLLKALQYAQEHGTSAVHLGQVNFNRKVRSDLARITFIRDYMVELADANDLLTKIAVHPGTIRDAYTITVARMENDSFITQEDFDMCDRADEVDDDLPTTNTSEPASTPAKPENKEPIEVEVEIVEEIDLSEEPTNPGFNLDDIQVDRVA